MKEKFESQEHRKEIKRRIEEKIKTQPVADFLLKYGITPEDERFPLLMEIHELALREAEDHMLQSDVEGVHYGLPEELRALRTEEEIKEYKEMMGGNSDISE